MSYLETFTGQEPDYCEDCDVTPYSEGFNFGFNLAIILVIFILYLYRGKDDKKNI